MNRKYLKRILPALFIIAASLMGSAWAQYAGESVVINEPLEDDLYAAGRSVEIRAALRGDAVVAAQRITLDGDVGGDVMAAAEDMALRGTIADDARLAGRVVMIESAVGGHLVAAGQRVTIGGDATIADDAWLAGSKIIVAGQIGRNLAVAGDNVEIGGRIGGNVKVYAEQVQVVPGAAIAGDFTAHSETPPSISDEASIGGQITHLPLELDGADPVAALLFTVASVALGSIILFLLFPSLGVSIVRRAQSAPLLHLAFGLVVFATVPVIIIMLFATAIGYVLALALMAVYAAVLLLGLMVAILCLGDLGLQLIRKGAAPSKWLRVLSVLAAALVYALVLLIPVIGWLAALLVLLSGIGALTLRAYEAWRQPPAAGSRLEGPASGSPAAG